MRLQVHPHCLMFFVDETGHEEFADPNYRVFGLGGCAVMAAAADALLVRPWRAMKKAHFGGEDVPLHASDLREPTADQIEALNKFFREQPIARFAVTMTAETGIPDGYVPYNFMPNSLRKRWEELAARARPTPVEVAFMHEASERGNDLLERYFGESVVILDGQQIPAHHGLMAKGPEELEVADFIIHTAGGQARQWARGDKAIRRDFRAIFHANRGWTSFHHITDIVPNGSVEQGTDSVPSPPVQKGLEHARSLLLKGSLATQDPPEFEDRGGVVAADDERRHHQDGEPD